MDFSVTSATKTPVVRRTNVQIQGGNDETTTARSVQSERPIVTMDPRVPRQVTKRGGPLRPRRGEQIADLACVTGPSTGVVLYAPRTGGRGHSPTGRKLNLRWHVRSSGRSREGGRLAPSDPAAHQLVDPFGGAKTGEGLMGIWPPGAEPPVCSIPAANGQECGGEHDQGQRYQQSQRRTLCSSSRIGPWRATAC